MYGMTFHYHFSEDKIRFLVVNLALFTILYKWYCRLFSPEDKKLGKTQGFLLGFSLSKKKRYPMDNVFYVSPSTELNHIIVRT